MSLPQIIIPAVNIPFDIPTLLHPALAHFAIAIPVLVVVAEIFNLFINGKGIKIMSSLFMFLLIAIFFGMYLTGTADGKAAMDNGFGAVSELKEHKLLGIYLFYASIFIFVLKLISLGVSKTGFKVFYILVLIGFLAGVLHQGKEGGELVYKYGANVQMQKDDFDEDEEDSKPAVKEETKQSESEKTTPAKEQKPEAVKEETKKEETKPEKTEEVKEAVEKKVEEIKDEVSKTVNEVTDLNKTEH